MKNISVYVVVNLTINDADEYRIYEKGFFHFKNIMEHLLHLMIPMLEGPRPLPEAIIFSFPSEEDANNWWNDVDYQELSKHRRAATDATIQLIKGLPPRE